MLDCTDCERCPTIHFMGDIARPRDEQAELHRAFVVAKDELAAILARMEALQGAGGN